METKKNARNNERLNESNRERKIRRRNKGRSNENKEE